MSSLNGGDDLSPNFINPTSSNINVTNVNGLITLQQLNNTVGLENNFDRTGTVLTPHVTGDSLDMLSGDIVMDTVSVGTNIMNNSACGIYGASPVVTDLGTGAVDIGACEVVLKANSTSSPKIYSVPQISNFSLTNQQLNYIKVIYNGGSPIYSVSTDVSDVDYISIVVVGQIFRDALVLYIDLQGINSTDVMPNLQAFLIRKYGFNQVTGLTMTTPTGGYFACTLGILYFGTSSTIVPAINTGTDPSATIEYLYRQGSTWIATVGRFVSNGGYNQGATSFQNLTNGFHNFYDVYYIKNSDVNKSYHLVLSQAQYNTDTAAVAAPRLTILPPELSNNKLAIYVGRFTYLKNATSATSIISAFSTVSSGNLVTSHSSLSNLSSDDHIQYAKLLSRDSTTQTFGTGRILIGITDDTFNNEEILKIKGTGKTAIALQSSSSNYNTREFVAPGANTDDSYGAFYGTGGWYSATANQGSYLIEYQGSNGSLTYYSGYATAGANISNWIPLLKLTTANTGTRDVLMPATYNSTCTSSPLALFIDNNGVLGSPTSTRASKIVSELGDVSFIYSLNPIRYRFRKTDSEGKYTDEPNSDIRYGLIAEEVEEVCSDLCIYNGDKLRTVSYDQLIIPTIKCVQDLKTKNTQLESRILQLETTLSTLIENYNNHIHVTDNVLSGKPTTLPSI